MTDIENFIWETSGKSIVYIESFLILHDQALDFIKQHTSTPANHPQTGDKSWPFGNGRYRLFFRYNGNDIELLDLIDNRMSNLKIYPNNILPTFDED